MRNLHCDLNMNNPGLYVPSGSPHGAIIHTGQQEHIVTGSIHAYLAHLSQIMPVWKPRIHTLSLKTALCRLFFNLFCVANCSSVCDGTVRFNPSGTRRQTLFFFIIFFFTQDKSVQFLADKPLKIKRTLPGLFHHRLFTERMFGEWTQFVSTASCLGRRTHLSLRMHIVSVGLPSNPVCLWKRPERHHRRNPIWSHSAVMLTWTWSSCCILPFVW